jgi:hypothetical protein
MEQQTKPKPGAPNPAPESKPAAAAEPKVAAKRKRAAASPGMPPLLSTLMKSQAELVRSASDVYVSTARRLLDGAERAEQPRR